jgi:pimeloyl-ACP methyl ester carboxylesterase
MNFLG